MIKTMSHVIFYGYYKSFDYYKIGGLESFYRRIASMLSEEERCRVSFVFYGGPSDDSYKITDSISLRYFKDFQMSLQYLLLEGSIVIDNYILKRHRISYLLFRTVNKKSIRFGHIYTGAPEEIQKKIVSLLNHKWPTFNGPVLSPSYTIHDKLAKFGIESKVMPPPIPANYSIFIPEKERARLKLTFIGRFDENKGISEVISLFKKLSINESAVDLCVSGYFGHGLANKEAIKDSFKSIKNLEIQEKSWNKWSTEMDKDVVKLLQETDILILPYHNLKGTMDPPLLVLEGMACGCLILTVDVGSVKEFYGESPFILNQNSFVDKAYDIINKILTNKNILKAEQERIAKKVKSLQLNTKSAVNCLLNNEG